MRVRAISLQPYEQTLANSMHEHLKDTMADYGSVKRRQEEIEKTLEALKEQQKVLMTIVALREKIDLNLVKNARIENNNFVFETEDQPRQPASAQTVDVRPNGEDRSDAGRPMAS